MRKILTAIFLVNCCLLPIFCLAQTDSVTLSYKEYITNILEYHPVAKKANLKLNFAEAEQMSAKGNLDPMVTSNWNQKDFDDKLYYRQFQSKLTIPTPLGIDVVGGYENTEGVFLNPENNTDINGLWNIGVEANILQGLIVNERRTAIQQARVFQELAKNEQAIVLNELLYTASYAYLQWQQYFFSQDVFDENIQIATTYFESTKQSFFNGEKTAMDTVEAYILLQDIRNFKLYNDAALIKARQKVENYLWYEQLPVGLQDSTKPDNYENDIFQISNIGGAKDLAANHPLILEKINKQTFFEIEQKLKREKLKPKLKLKYHPLLSTSDDNISPAFNESDYKWGFDFSFPLFLRSERAGIQKGEIKLQEISLDIENKQNELTNKIENSIQQQVIYQNQAERLRQNVDGYKQLLDGENEKYRLGESSVFLLNKRQEKYINGRLKLIELNIKYQSELLDYLYFTNGLINL